MAALEPNFRTLRNLSLPVRLLNPYLVHTSRNSTVSTFQFARATFSTSRLHNATVEEVEPIKAAPEIDFEATRPNANAMVEPASDMSEEKFRKLRIVPASSSYFTARPTFTDDLIRLQAVLHRWQRLPITKPSEAPRTTWMTFDEYKNASSEPIRPSRYGLITSVLRRLNLIIPSMRPKEVVETIREFSKGIDPSLSRAKPILIDEWGRARGLGRRKASSAQVWLVEGEGEVLVNGKTLPEAFSRVHDRESVVWALKTTDRLGKYNVWAIVNGGGTTGQAEALTLGVAKALMAHEPLLKKTLRKGKLNPMLHPSNQIQDESGSLFFDTRLMKSLIAGCVTRDPRRVERKKPGHVKARKMPTWVKR